MKRQVPSIALAPFTEKVLRQQRQVILAILQWRNFQRHGIQAVIQIFAKFSFFG